jgi:hypothetical protein
MAVKKKKSAKKAKSPKKAKQAKRAVKKAVGRPAAKKSAAKKTATKRTARKAAPAKKKAAKRPAPLVKTKAKKKAKKKSFIAKAIGSVGEMFSPRKAKASKDEIGEGNYKASKRFRDSEEAFVKKNKTKLPELGKEAEAALDGPEGDELRAAEASTAARGEGMES